MIISGLQAAAKPIFGSFEREEFKKFLRMGVIFAVIIGSYWTLRVLKDAIFINFVDKHDIPWAKTASLFCLFPLVAMYTRLFDRYSREQVFYMLSGIYGTLTFFFAASFFFFQAPQEVIAARTGMAWFLSKFLGYFWYVFVESYGSLIVALFWAIATDITASESAKKGFYLVTALGQFGGIIGPMFISSLRSTLGLDTSALSVGIVAFGILGLSALMKNFMRVTPSHLLASFHGKNEKHVEEEQEPGFFEGLRLLLKHNYLLGIFAAICIYEIIVTIFDFNFKVVAATQYSGAELEAYLGKYGASVNIVSLICLLGGVSNITRRLGVGVALAMMPIIVGCALLGFITLDSLNFLFYLMVGAKAVNYALNGPAMKQLYIPTTPDVRFKSQAWIETFGSRGSKEAASLFNLLLKPLQASLGAVAGRAKYIALSGYLGFALVAVWFFTALFLGKTYKKAIDQNKVVC